MLYIFSQNNSLQIAWDSKTPKNVRESRTEQLFPRLGNTRFIRTWSAG
ncbi:hypothetical protein HFC70_14985 [Agrobacterium sp. a22-2]|nr:hypothetical protein [Agrobacterium sp. a22-2]NKN37656.1 hypothetical protein [Agrobacterium sp. a22-2]